MGYGGELIAAADAVCAEAACEDAADGGDEGASSGEEDAVDGARMNPGGLKQGVDGAFDGVQVVGYPGFELGAGYWNAEVEIG